MLFCCVALVHILRHLPYPHDGSSPLVLFSEVESLSIIPHFWQLQKQYMSFGGDLAQSEGEVRALIEPLRLAILPLLLAEERLAPSAGSRFVPILAFWRGATARAQAVARGQDLAISHWFEKIHSTLIQGL